MAGPKNDDPKVIKDKIAKLLQQSKAGVLKPQNADDEAARLKFGTLSRDIPMDEFHPIAQTRWTLTMVLAWITWRSYSEVREWDAEYLSRCRYWGAVGLGKTGAARTVKTGSRLYKRRPPTFASFETWGDRRFGPLAVGVPIFLQSCEAQNARPALWKALLDEILAAAAIKHGGGARVLIPAHEWQDLEVHQDPSGRDVLVYRHDPNKWVYKDISWLRRDVTSFWAPHRFSELPDDANIQSDKAAVEEAPAWNEIYEWLDDEEILNVPVQAKLGSKSRRKGTAKDFKELKDLQQALFNKGGPLLDYEDMKTWADEQGIGRDWVRDVRKQFPKHLILKRGQHSTLADK